MENNGEALAEEKPNYDTNDRPARRDTFPRTRYLIEQQWYKHALAFLANSAHSSPGPIVTANESKATADAAKQPAEHEAESGSAQAALVPSHTLEELKARFGGGRDADCVYAAPVEGVLTPLLDRSKQLRVEVLCGNRTDAMNNPSATLVLSKYSTLDDLRDEASEALGFDAYNARCVDFYNHSWHACLDDSQSNMQLSQLNLIDEQEILFETKDADGNLPPEPEQDSIIPMPDVTSSSTLIGMPDATPSVPQENDVTRHGGEAGNTAGHAGLKNLGNTCFANSALQCLSHSPSFVSHFLLNKYEEEINSDNPIGNSGELAREYGTLLKLLWDKNALCVAPHRFKQKIGETAPRFTGYQQQDAQELLVFLLDGLHEDLNRVRQKPYIEFQDDQGRSEEVVAEEHWNNYLKRNDSIVVDLFTGQHKSTLECPRCSHTSITFEPFVYLSLPLPSADVERYKIRFVHADGARRSQWVAVQLTRRSSILELENAVATKLQLQRTQRLVTLRTAITNTDRVESLLLDKQQQLGMMSERNLVVNKLPALQNGELDNSRYELSAKDLVVVQHVRRGATEGTSGHESRYILGTPFVVEAASQNSLAREEKMRLLESRIEQALEPYAYAGAKGSDPKVSKLEQSSSNSTRRSYTVVETDRYGVLHQDDDVGMTKQTVHDGSTVDAQQMCIDPQEQERFVAVEWDTSIATEAFDLSALRSPDELPEHNEERATQLDLEKCIQAYTTPEKLEPSEAWFCPKCRDHVEASKKLDLWLAPPLLVVHLKRFQYQRLWRQKLDAYVDFPIEGLDLSKFVHKCKGYSGHSARPVYDLYGVVHHYGSMLGGHYTACAKQPGSAEWLSFDDDRVTPMRSPEEAKRNAAYLLFYKRRDVSEPEASVANDGSA